MLQRIAICGVLAAALLPADSVLLKSGRRVQGDYLGGDARRVRIAVGDAVETFAVEDITEIRFGAASGSTGGSSAGATSGASAATPSGNRPATSRNPILRPESDTPPVSSRAAGGTTRSGVSTAAVEIPAGTTIAVRMIDDVDSERDSTGQEFRASIDEPVVLDGRTVVPRGANVTAKLVAEKQAGQLSGRTTLTLDLTAIEINGRMVDVLTEEVTQQSESRTEKTAKTAGGGAVLGAVIGAIAGGGKGAAIGAVTGAAAGGAVQVLTRGERVRIPSETRLTFTLQRPLRP